MKGLRSLMETYILRNTLCCLLKYEKWRHVFHLFSYSFFIIHSYKTKVLLLLLLFMLIWSAWWRYLLVINDAERRHSSSWQTFSSRMVLSVMCSLSGSISAPFCIISLSSLHHHPYNHVQSIFVLLPSPPCCLCAQWISWLVIAIIRVCTYLLGFYGLFLHHLYSIPPRSGYFQVFHHTCQNQGNESSHDSSYFTVFTIVQLQIVLFSLTWFWWNITNNDLDLGLNVCWVALKGNSGIFKPYFWH